MTTTATQGGQDIASILMQLKATESEKDRLNRELEDVRRRLDEEQRVANETKGKLGKLQEGKRTEMQNSLDNAIKKWLSDITTDEALKKQFEAGLTRLVENTEEDSGVWQVACCASNTYLRKLQEIEEIKGQYEELKKGATPEFARDDARKRQREDEPARNQPRDVWEDFEQKMKQGTFDAIPVMTSRHGEPDPLNSFLSRIPAGGAFNPAL